MEVEVELELLVISLCCMKAVMKKDVRVKDYNSRFKGMVDMGANTGYTD